MFSNNEISNTRDEKDWITELERKKAESVEIRVKKLNWKDCLVWRWYRENAIKEEVEDEDIRKFQQNEAEDTKKNFQSMLFLSLSLSLSHRERLSI